MKQIIATILVAVALVGCTSMSTQPFQVVSGARELDLKWGPKEGMRLVHLVTLEIKLSGVRARSVPWNQRAMRSTTTRIVDISTVTADYFDLSMSEAGSSGTLRFSTTDWTLLRVTTPDAIGGVKEKRLDDIADLKPVQEFLQQSTQFFRRWTVGEIYPIQARFPPIPGSNDKINVTIATTLRRVVLINGRAAAEFDYIGGGETALQGLVARMTASGTAWIDLATGVGLRKVEKGRLRLSDQGGLSEIELGNEEMLDFAKSRLW